MSNKTPFSIRFNQELLNHIRRVSIIEGISMTQIIEQAVRKYIDNWHDKGDIADG